MQEIQIQVDCVPSSEVKIEFFATTVNGTIIDLKDIHNNPNSKYTIEQSTIANFDSVINQYTDVKALYLQRVPESTDFLYGILVNSVHPFRIGTVVAVIKIRDNDTSELIENNIFIDIQSKTNDGDKLFLNPDKVLYINTQY